MIITEIKLLPYDVKGLVYVHVPIKSSKMTANQINIRVEQDVWGTNGASMEITRRNPINGILRWV